jgi:hypothetical protein
MTEALFGPDEAIWTIEQSGLAMDPFYPEMVDRWTLPEDGRKLTITRRLRAMSGEDSQKFVFNKQ